MRSGTELGQFLRVFLPTLFADDYIELKELKGLEI